MELSVRALNCLKAAEIETFADLVSVPRHELMKFRNFGKNHSLKLICLWSVWISLLE